MFFCFALWKRETKAFNDVKRIKTAFSHKYKTLFERQLPSSCYLSNVAKSLLSFESENENENEDDYWEQNESPGTRVKRS